MPAWNPWSSPGRPWRRGGRAEISQWDLLLFSRPALVVRGGGGGSSWSLHAPGMRSNLVGCCCLKGRNSISSSYLARDGGRRRGGDGDVALSRRRRPLPKRCYIGKLNHTRGSLDSVIFYRHGGESSTFNKEALLRICRRSSMIAVLLARSWR
jgi:hypothetical protein